MTSQRHRFFRFLFIPLLILAVLLGLVLFRQHAGLPTRFSTQSNTPWNLILVNNEHALPRGYSPELTTLSNGVQVDSRIYTFYRVCLMTCERKVSTLLSARVIVRSSSNRR